MDIKGGILQMLRMGRINRPNGQTPPINPRSRIGRPTGNQQVQEVEDSPIIDESSQLPVPRHDRGGNDFDHAAELEGLVRQPMPVLETYRNYLQEAPNREDYAPRMRDRAVAGIAGGLAGFGSGGQVGINTATEMLDRPYRQATEDYNSKVARLSGLAKAEGDERTDRIRGYEALTRLDKESSMADNREDLTVLKTRDLQRKIADDASTREYYLGKLRNEQDRNRVAQYRVQIAEIDSRTRAYNAELHARDVTTREKRETRMQAGVDNPVASTRPRPAVEARVDVNDDEGFADEVEAEMRGKYPDAFNEDGSIIKNHPDEQRIRGEIDKKYRDETDRRRMGR